MSRIVRTAGGVPVEPDEFDREADRETERMIRSWRGRWMVVDATGFASRHRSLRSARALINCMRSAGVSAHMRRWRRRDVVYVGGGFEVTRSELAP